MDIEIRNREKELPNEKIRNIKFQLKKWIRKRYIIEQLFKGKCVGCGKITVKNNLGALCIHHKTLSDNNIKWPKIAHLDCENIANILMKEDCSCLCINCHALIHSTGFVENANEILGDEYGQMVKQNFENIKNRINEFNICKNKSIISPLKVKFSFGQIWKKYLINIHKLIQEKDFNEFTAD